MVHPQGNSNSPKPKYKNKYRIESTRLPCWNYATPGGYFITICTYQKQCFFGEIIHQTMHLSTVGEIADRLWREIPQRFPNCQIDEFVVMPNHIHGILILRDLPAAQPPAIAVDSVRYNPGGVTGSFNPMRSPNSISNILRWYKSKCKYEIGKICPEFAWQARFYDEIIRNEESRSRIREYIVNNPLKWDDDEQNPSYIPF